MSSPPIAAMPVLPVPLPPPLSPTSERTEAPGVPPVKRDTNPGIAFDQLAAFIVRASEFAALSNGPWELRVPLGEDYEAETVTFYDFRTKQLAAKVRRTGGTISKISEMEYDLSPLGLIAHVSPSGIVVERSNQSALPIGSLLTCVRIARSGLGDIAVWVRCLSIAGCPARETDDGLAVSVPRGALPEIWQAALCSADIDCYASFRGLDAPEVFDFGIEHTPSLVVLNLIMDQAQRDTIWEAIKSSETMAERQSAPSRVTGGATHRGETTIASAPATLRFCEHANPGEAMLVITTKPEGRN